MINIIYLILAILGLGFLIFIHELGHLLMAHHCGIAVEVFSIGFGPVLRRGEIKGIKWQLCAFPFGGYVRMAGMEKKDGLEPIRVVNGFYGKRPIDRIKVALAGPLANIIFALFAFFLIWLSGGQKKPFQQYTQIIGYVDHQSKLYEKGIRPGDELLYVDGRKLMGYQDLLVSLLFSDKKVSLQGNEINYFSGQKEPFSLSLPSSHQTQLEQLGILPAQYLIFNNLSSLHSPLKGSGIEKGDRILWVDGELIFSHQQLLSTINESKTLLSVKRDGKSLLVQVPRLKVSDLRLKGEQRNELEDWSHEAGLKPFRVEQLYFIPYLLTHDNVVIDPLAFMNRDAEETRPVHQFRHPLSQLLQPGDRIVAVDGVAVAQGSELLKNLQNRKALMIVQRENNRPISSWKSADALFQSSFQPSSIEKLISKIGSSESSVKEKNLILLPPITLKSLPELKLNRAQAKQLDADYQEKKRSIEKIENPEEREYQLALLEQSQKQLMLGALLTDQMVAYNPTPAALFTYVFHQTWKTLTHLFSGSQSSKALTGPIGIVQALQYSLASGAKEALFWLGFVSLNLAFLNLLPIPVLDGGHVLFASIEAITKKPIKAKTMEKFIFPFILLLIVLFVYLTYQDIAKLMTRFFH